MNTHKIWKQTIEYTLDDKDRAWEIQNRMSIIFASGAAKVLDRHLNALCPENQHIVIDSLECNLGEISLNTLESDLIDALENILPISLAKVIEPQKNSAAPNREAPKSLGQDHPGSDDDVPPQTEVPLSGIAVLIIYLKTGTLPWSFGEPGFDDFIDTLSTGLQLITHDEKETLKQVLSHPHASTRFIQIFPRQFIKRCLDVLWPEATLCLDIADQLIRHIHNSEQSVMPDRHLDRLIYSLVLKILINDPSRASRSFIPVFTKAVQKKVSPLKPIILKGLELFPLKTTHRKSFLPSDALDMAKTLFSRTTGSLDDSPPPSPAAQTAPPDKDVILKQQGYSISNAGVVLTATFLVPYFKALGLLDKDQLFLSEDARVLAILSLHVLHNGPVFPAEYMCVLNKLLCGMPIQTPCLFVGQHDFMPPGLDSPDLKSIDKEAQKLLSAMIRHWAKIKNTSVSGVRQSFLKRDGILREHKNCWVLQIERKGYDVLLASIPWSFSLIKTPWMKKPLEVQW